MLNVKWVAFGLLVGMATTMGVGSAASDRDGHQFRMGFKALADQIPEVVGQPIEDEHYGPNGDSLQRTTTGLMAWRKVDNWTAFTNGARTWINGPFAAQDRANDKRFEWEAPEEPGPPAAAAGPRESTREAVTAPGIDPERPDPDRDRGNPRKEKDPTTEGTPDEVAAEHASLEMINESRRQSGLGPVRMDGKLRAVARAHARDMAERGYFGHSDPQGKSPFDRLKSEEIPYRYASENLGYGTGYSPRDTVRANHEMMMGEKPPGDGHRRNILDGQYRKVGIGVHSSRDGKVYYVSVFTD